LGTLSRSNALIDPPFFGGHPSFDQGEVGFADQPLLELLADFAVCPGILGDENDAGSLAVQTVAEFWDDVLAGVLEVAIHSMEDVDQSAGESAARRVDRKAWGFVDGEEIGVFKKDMK
jgi:hypothetical protein